MPLRPVTFWIVWGGILSGLVLITALVPPSSQPGVNPALAYVPLLPLCVSAVVRFVVIPRISTLPKAFPVFLIGVAMAEASGLLGKFLSGPPHDMIYFGAALAMLALYVPFFTQRMSKE